MKKIILAIVAIMTAIGVNAQTKISNYEEDNIGHSRHHDCHRC